MNRLIFFCWRLEEELLKKINGFRVKKTKYGLKTINVKLVRQIPRIISDCTFELEPSQLFLGIDYLKDEFTLLDTPVMESPHLRFVDSILHCKDLSETDYIIRYQNGTLDGRRGVPKVTNYNKFNDRCASRIDQLEDMQPVLVYQIRNRYYIYDGKHRAALCALKGKSVKCLLVDYNFANNALFKLMGKENNNYSRHLNLLK